ncbi:hypothetical protein JHS3_12680 [Jeongeupia sp. HS-3]|uniref:prepilin-type N-terminal cleavage/methylation domain-containing protein n=1 Tax=Jeongeupia sp. HS-3 TaxID=1009682 RepID=UPI0018A56B3E|nr:prepilin-type N-terminal cleavage/methylation domain-containing protein [Jeongeupia sp. HS-3]BCL75532.1 hypothetical protein JHS3_12680 [Jeongeupia sp. HS-3]
MQRGITLMEILIALAIGVLLLSAAASIGLSSLAGNKDALINANTQQELQTVSMAITRELRRSGYANTEAVAPTFRQIWFFGGSGQNDHNCVVFRYDRLPESTTLAPPGNGTLTAAEVRGVRLNGNRIEILTTGNLGAPANCAAAGTWEPLTSTNLTVTADTGLDLDYRIVRLQSDGLPLANDVTITLSAQSSNGNASTLAQTVLLRNRPQVMAPTP